MKPTGRPLLSVVAPVFNEEDTVVEFYGRCRAKLHAVAPPADFEILLVNDGSLDRSAALLEAICDRDAHVRLVTLSRNIGHQAA